MLSFFGRRIAILFGMISRMARAQDDNLFTHAEIRIFDLNKIFFYLLMEIPQVVAITIKGLKRRTYEYNKDSFMFSKISIVSYSASIARSYSVTDVLV